MLDFLLGRPLVDTIEMFDIQLVKKNGNYGLARASRFLKKCE